MDGGGESTAEKLEGHDVAELMLDWARKPVLPPHRREQAAAQVCHDIVELQKLPKHAWKEDDRGSVAELSIEAALKDHEGEARVWQLGAERWEPLREAAILEGGESCMGKDYPGTFLPRTFEERLDAFRASEPLRMCSQRRNVY